MPNLDLRDPIARALDEAIAGRRDSLIELLTRGSRLPGPRMNSALADSFAIACRSRGAAAESVAVALASLSVGEAAGATAYEFLPVCGLIALGTRAGTELGARTRLVAVLHSHADDTRYRVRDATVIALSRAGATEGDSLLAGVDGWMEGYFHAATVLHAMSSDPWLSNLGDVTLVVERLDQAFELARTAPRAAARYPGHKELVGAVSRDPAALAARFGRPIFALFERWARVDLPPLRAAVADLVGSSKLAGRFGQDIERVRRELDASLPPPRNPDHDVGPTRHRSRR
ncbi:MAG: hypothetical protein ABTD50_10660 [Polyangiaceae bacterium]|jgi:hypothetical protein